MLLKRSKATSNSDHHSVSLDHQHRRLRSNHVLALVVLVLLLQFHDWQQAKQNQSKFCLLHNLKEFVLFDRCDFGLCPSLFGDLVQQRLLVSQILWRVDDRDLVCKHLSTDLIHVSQFFIDFQFNLCGTPFLFRHQCCLTHKCSSFLFDDVVDLLFSLRNVLFFLRSVK